MYCIIQYVLPLSLSYYKLLVIFFKQNYWLRSEIRPQCFEVLLCRFLIQSVAISQMV